MAKKSKRIDKGIILTPDTDATSAEGELKYNDSEKRVKYRDDAGEQEVVAKDKAQILTGKTIDSASNTLTVNADEATVSELKTDNFKAGVVDTDGTLATPSDTKLPTSQAVKTYVDAQIQTKDEASEISYDNTASGLTATDVQAAIDETEGRLDTAESNISTNASNLSDHLADAVDAHDSSAISYDNTTSGLTATDAQAAIDEVEGRVDTVETAASGAQTAIDDHIADAVDAHDASAISNVPAGNLAATDVQGALNELQSDIDTRALDSDLTDHISDAVDAHDASAISNVPAGNLAATDVQGALNELQSDIDTRALDSDLTTHTGASSGVHGVTGDVVGTTDAQTLTSKSIQAPTRLDAKPDTLANLTVYATTAQNGEFVYATDTKEYYGIEDGALVPLGGGGGGTSFNQSQVAHGFAVLDAIYHNGTSWVKAQGDDANTLAQYVVTAVQDVDNFTAQNFGKVEITGHGKTVGEFYFLSETVAGGSEITEGEIYSAPLYYVEDANNIHIFVYRPSLKPQLTQFREDVDLLSNILDFDTTSAGFSLETTVNGETFRLTHDAGSTRFAEKTLECTPKFRGKQLQVNVDMTSTAASGNFKVIVTDETNATTLADEQLIYLGDSPTEKKVVKFTTASTTASIKVRFEALQESGSPVSDFDDITVGLSKTEVKEISVIEQEENTFAAKITNNGTVSIVSQSKSFISNVTRIAAGQVDVTFIAGFFTTIPAVMAQPIRSLTGSGDRNMIVTNLSTSGCRITSQVANNGTDIDNDFDLIVERQGSDYKNLQRRVEREESSFKEVLVEENDSMIRLSQPNGFGSSGTRIRRFSNVEESLGSAITYIDSVTDGASFRIEESGVYLFSWSDRSLSGTVGIGFSKNATDLTTNVWGLPDGEGLTLDYLNASGSNNQTTSWQGYLQKGDIIRPHVGISGSFYEGVDNWVYFTATKQGSLKKVEAAPDSKIEIPTSEVRFEGLNAAIEGSGAEDTTIWFENASLLRGDAFSIDNSNGTVVTIQKDGMITVTAGLYNPTASNGRYGISLNDPNPELTPFITQYIKDTAVVGTPAGGSLDATMAWTGFVKAGDKIRIKSQDPVNPRDDSNGDYINYLNLSHQEQRISVAVSNVTPQFEDADSMVRVHSSGGTGSTNTAIRRFTVVEDNIGSAITYTDSATDGASFTINETGFYTISYDDTNTAGSSDNFGITLNASNLTSQPDSLPRAEVLAITENGPSTSRRGNVSWQGILNEGDIIRAQCGPVDPTAFNQFTIAKVGVPSIAEVDVTPFADVNRVERQNIRFDGHSGFGSTNTRIPYFTNTRDLAGDNLLSVENSSVNGLSFTALKDCTVTASYTAAGTSLARFGWSKNASSGTIELTTLSADERLSISSGDSANVEDTSTVTIKLKEGDILRPHTDSFTAAVTTRHHVTITAEADSRDRLYSVEQTENEFSARIDSAGAILSQSQSFIDSVTKNATGDYTVNFVSGFFTEIPSVLVTSQRNDAAANQWSIRELTTTSLRINMEGTDGVTGFDTDFNISVSRQGADRKDLQEAIVQLTDFPRVNRRVSQLVRYKGYAGDGSTATAIPYFSTLDKNEGSNILTIDNSSVNGFSMTANKDCTVHAHYVAVAAGLYTGWSLNSTFLTSEIFSNDNNPFRVGGGNNFHTGGNDSATSSVSIRLKAGDVLRPHTNGVAWTSTTDPQIEIVAEADDLERVSAASTFNTQLKELSTNVSTSGVISDLTHDNLIVGRQYLITAQINFQGTGLKQVQVRNGGTVIGNMDSQASSEDTASFSKIITATDSTLDFNFSTATSQIQGGGSPSATFSQVTDLSAQIIAALPSPKGINIEHDATGRDTIPSTTAYKTRDITAISGDTEIASLSSNQLTLGKGKYKLTVNTGWLGDCSNCSFGLYNVTDASYIYDKVIASCGGAGDDQGASVTFQFTLVTQKTLEFRTKVAQSAGTTEALYDSYLEKLD